jgi:hypothetical protein
MAMFGRRKPAPLTGSLPILGPVSGFGGGTFDMDGTATTPVANLAQPITPIAAPQDDPKRWLEGGKFGWRDGVGLALGAVGDALTQRPVTTSLVHGAFQQNRALKQQEQQRQAGLSDWLWKEQYKRNNPEPAAPTALQRNYEFLSGMDPELGEQYLANSANPIQGVPVTNPDGSKGIMFVRPGGMGAQSGGDLPRVSSPDEARRLPPGSQFIMPDGRIGTVPGGGSGNATGGF